MSRFEHVLTRINAAATRSGRTGADIKLLAVSKKQSLEKITALVEAGQTRFGESYVDEALGKIDALSSARLEWHFIGPVQSNKTRALAERFDWVQSVDRAKIVRRLNEQRPAEMAPLNVLIQVNPDGESQKAGCDPDRIEELAAMIDAAPRLTLRGLMAIPAPRRDPAAQGAVFAGLRDLFEALAGKRSGVDTLSAGMSGDLEAAIANGSTMVRVGTDLFGPRPNGSAHVQ